SESGLNRARRKLTPTLPTSNLFDIAPGYQTTASGETFLICDKMSSMVFLDGTFNATPPFFDQIFTIHGLKFDCAFPCIFAVLPDRKKATYQELFQEVKSIAASMGLMQAVSTEFPLCVHKDCFYHYSQCLYRRIQSTGLATAYSQDEALRSCCKKLMALPFLPINEV
ncbi:unnamed protein product, partial [Adineta ricciae]